MTRMENLNVRRQVQYTFTKFHLLLMFPIAGYLITKWTLEKDHVYILFAIGMFSVMLIENILFLTDKIPVLFISALRYIEACMSVILFWNVEGLVNPMIALTVMSTCYVEFFLSIRFSNRAIRNLYIVSILIPLEMGCVIHFYIKRDTMEHFTISVLSCLVYVFFIWFLTKMFANGVQMVNERIQKQQDIINDMKEANKLLERHQSDMLNTNELLFQRQQELEQVNEEIQSVNVMIRLQNTIIHNISSSLELEELIRNITNLIVEEMEVELCAVSIFTEVSGNKEYVYHISSRYGRKFDESMKEALEQHILEQYIQDKKEYNDNFVVNEKYSWMKDAMIGSLLVLPIIKEGKNVGLLCAAHPTHCFFKEKINNFFTSIVTEITVALKNVDLYKQMEHVETHDSLTGLYNRGKIMKILTKEINHAMSYHKEISVILFDIDYLKRINDYFGLLAGDEVVQKIAKCGFSIAKEYEGIIGRYGGDEFVILFPDCSEEEACHRVRELHRRIKEVKIKDEEICISSGISVFPNTCNNPRDVLIYANMAMRYSKQNGKDCMTMDSPIVRNAVKMK